MSKVNYERGVVESVKPLVKARSGTVIWREVRLKGVEKPFALHMNWFVYYGETLKPGDKVEYILSKAKLDKDGSQGVDREGWLLFDRLRKVKREAKLEEEMKKFVEETG